MRSRLPARRRVGVLSTGPAATRFAAGLVGILLPVSATGQSVPGVEPVEPCFVQPADDVESAPVYDCGYVVVPEDPGRPDGPTVRLGFLRMSSPAATKRAPLFMLSGGPGGTLIQPIVFSLFRPGFLGPVLATRDVVILDQRGTMHADPVLDCAEYHSLAWSRYLQGTDEDGMAARLAEVLGYCFRDVREEGVDLATYNSVVIAADVEAARRALGYDRIAYYGASYGAQLGQHFMRDYPGSLEAVVLDGANSLSRRSWVEDRALDVDYSLRHLSEICEADPKCAAAYDLPELVERGLSLFDDGPIPVTWTDPDSGRVMEFDLRVGDYVGFVYEKLGYKYGAEALPYLLSVLVKDGRTSMAEGLGAEIGQKMLSQRFATSGSLATLMHYAVVCSDDPVRSVDEVVLEGVQSRLAKLFGQLAAREYVIACEIADVPGLPDETDVDVTVDVPTLVLSGGIDAQTPTFRSEIVAGSLPNARLVVFPDGTHVQLGAVNLCAARILTSFLADPGAPLPTDCLAESRWQGFLLPDGTISGQ